MAAKSNSVRAIGIRHRSNYNVIIRCSKKVNAQFQLLTTTLYVTMCKLISFLIPCVKIMELLLSRRLRHSLFNTNKVKVLAPPLYYIFGLSFRRRD